MQSYALGRHYPNANGSITLNLKSWFGISKDVTIYGGPFRTGYIMTDNNFGVCLTESAPKPCDIHLPIEDFSIPHQPVAVVLDDVKATLKAALDGKAVYVGCMGGFGRTGLFLSILARAAGHPDPVKFVRQEYTPRAVETSSQHLYVDAFDMADLPAFLRKEVAKSVARDLLRKLTFRTK